MNNKITVSALFSISASATATLPEGKTHEDIANAQVFLKYDDLHIIWADGTQDNFPLDSHLDFALDYVDTKYPTDVEIYKTDESGQECFDDQLQ